MAAREANQLTEEEVNQLFDIYSNLDQDVQISIRGGNLPPAANGFARALASMIGVRTLENPKLARVAKDLATTERFIPIPAGPPPEEEIPPPTAGGIGALPDGGLVPMPVVPAGPTVDQLTQEILRLEGELRGVLARFPRAAVLELSQDKTKREPVKIIGKQMKGTLGHYIVGLQNLNSVTRHAILSLLYMSIIAQNGVNFRLSALAIRLQYLTTLGEFDEGARFVDPVVHDLLDVDVPPQFKALFAPLFRTYLGETDLLNHNLTIEALSMLYETQLNGFVNMRSIVSVVGHVFMHMIDIYSQDMEGPSDLITYEEWKNRLRRKYTPKLIALLNRATKLIEMAAATKARYSAVSVVAGWFGSEFNMAEGSNLRPINGWERSTGAGASFAKAVYIAGSLLPLIGNAARFYCEAQLRRENLGAWVEGQTVRVIYEVDKVTGMRIKNANGNPIIKSVTQPFGRESAAFRAMRAQRGMTILREEAAGAAAAEKEAKAAEKAAGSAATMAVVMAATGAHQRAASAAAAQKAAIAAANAAAAQKAASASAASAVATQKAANAAAANAGAAQKAANAAAAQKTANAASKVASEASIARARAVQEREKAEAGVTPAKARVTSAKAGVNSAEQAESAAVAERNAAHKAEGVLIGRQGELGSRIEQIQDANRAFIDANRGLVRRLGDLADAITEAAGELRDLSKDAVNGAYEVRHGECTTGLSGALSAGVSVFGFENARMFCGDKNAEIWLDGLVDNEVSRILRKLYGLFGEINEKRGNIEGNLERMERGNAQNDQTTLLSRTQDHLQELVGNGATPGKLEQLQGLLLDLAQVVGTIGAPAFTFAKSRVAAAEAITNSAETIASAVNDGARLNKALRNAKIAKAVVVGVAVAALAAAAVAAAPAALVGGGSATVSVAADAAAASAVAATSATTASAAAGASSVSAAASSAYATALAAAQAQGLTGAAAAAAAQSAAVAAAQAASTAAAAASSASAAAASAASAAAASGSVSLTLAGGAAVSNLAIATTAATAATSATASAAASASAATAAAAALQASFTATAAAVASGTMTAAAAAEAAAAAAALAEAAAFAGAMATAGAGAAATATAGAGAAATVTILVAAPPGVTIGLPIMTGVAAAAAAAGAAAGLTNAVIVGATTAGNVALLQNTLHTGVGAQANRARGEGIAVMNAYSGGITALPELRSRLAELNTAVPAAALAASTARAAHNIAVSNLERAAENLGKSQEALVGAESRLVRAKEAFQEQNKKYKAAKNAATTAKKGVNTAKKGVNTAKKDAATAKNAANAARKDANAAKNAANTARNAAARVSDLSTYIAPTATPEQQAQQEALQRHAECVVAVQAATQRLSLAKSNLDALQDENAELLDRIERFTRTNTTRPSYRENAPPGAMPMNQAEWERMMGVRLAPVGRGNLEVIEEGNNNNNNNNRPRLGQGAPAANAAFGAEPEWQAPGPRGPPGPPGIRVPPPPLHVQGVTVYAGPRGFGPGNYVTSSKPSGGGRGTRHKGRSGRKARWTTRKVGGQRTVTQTLTARPYTSPTPGAMFRQNKVIVIHPEDVYATVLYNMRINFEMANDEAKIQSQIDAINALMDTYEMILTTL